MSFSDIDNDTDTDTGTPSSSPLLAIDGSTEDVFTLATNSIAGSRSQTPSATDTAKIELQDVKRLLSRLEEAHLDFLSLALAVVYNERLFGMDSLDYWLPLVSGPTFLKNYEYLSTNSNSYSNNFNNNYSTQYNESQEPEISPLMFYYHLNRHFKSQNIVKAISRKDVCTVIRGYIPLFSTEPSQDPARHFLEEYYGIPERLRDWRILYGDNIYQEIRENLKPYLDEFQQTNFGKVFKFLASLEEPDQRWVMVSCANLFTNNLAIIPAMLATSSTAEYVVEIFKGSVRLKNVLCSSLIPPSNSFLDRSYKKRQCLLGFVCLPGKPKRNFLSYDSMGVRTNEEVKYCSQNGVCVYCGNHLENKQALMRYSGNFLNVSPGSVCIENPFLGRYGITLSTTISGWKNNY